MLKSRMKVAKLYDGAIELIVNKNFSVQVTITNALFAMTIEKPINFNRRRFESPKNSSYF